MLQLKLAERICSAVKSVLGQNTVNLHHLRRVVKDGYLPENLIRAKAAKPDLNLTRDVLRNDQDKSLAADEGGNDTYSISPINEAAYTKYTPPETVHIFLAPTSIITPSALYTHLHNQLPQLFPRPASSPINPPISPEILTLPLPTHSPTNPTHAANLSRTLWPTTYNPNTTYGPTPSVLTSAATEIAPNAGYYITLARHVGSLAKASGRGEGFGAVIVERVERRGRVVSVAGDGRWVGCGVGPEREKKGRGNGRKGNGNPAKHAVMRGIDMVAGKRRALLATSTSTSNNQIIEVTSLETHTTTQTTAPISPLLKPQPGDQDALASLEQLYLNDNTNLTPQGYLCLNLEVYTSHEPCIMCSMALVHSRVGRVVFGRRMRGTGGLCADHLKRRRSRGEEEEHKGEHGRVEGTGEGEGEEGVCGKGAVEGTGGEREKKGLDFGYGLFWREELNWRFLCWEWVDEDDGHASAVRVDDEDGNVNG